MTPPRSRRARLIPVVLFSTALLAGCSLSEASSAPKNSAAGDTVYFGVSAPVTGPLADYGRLWKQGFDLALDSVNAAGGIDGKKVALKWEDSQSDPKQTVPIAQKFVADASVIAELGDFSSPASIAASPTYTTGKLVQFGFTNSSPDFTAGGEYQWSPCLTQTIIQKGNAELVRKYSRKVAVVYQETDWGKQAFDIFSMNAAAQGLTITYSSSFLPDSTDLRPILIKARDSKPEALVHLGYWPCPDSAAPVT
jgi:branched-chain amino acid transport system substrate-binding protein